MELKNMRRIIEAFDIPELKDVTPEISTATSSELELKSPFEQELSVKCEFVLDEQAKEFLRKHDEHIEQLKQEARKMLDYCRHCDELRREMK